MARSALDMISSIRDGETNGRLSKALAGFDGKPRELIPMLQRVQKEFGYLPENALLEIAGLTGLSPARVYGVATFYAQFRLEPIGKYIVKVCRGTACHVSGSDLILDNIQEFLGIGPGGTTKDGLFTLETVACFGCCALAPVVVINEHVYASMTAVRTRELLDELRQNELGGGEVQEVGAGKDECCNGLC